MPPQSSLAKSINGHAEPVIVIYLTWDVKASFANFLFQEWKGGRIRFAAGVLNSTRFHMLVNIMSYGAHNLIIGKNPSWTKTMKIGRRLFWRWGRLSNAKMTFMTSGWLFTTLILSMSIHFISFTGCQMSASGKLVFWYSKYVDLTLDSSFVLVWVFPGLTAPM